MGPSGVWQLARDLYLYFVVDEMTRRVSLANRQASEWKAWSRRTCQQPARWRRDAFSLRFFKRM